MLLFLELFLRDEIFGRYLLSLGIFIHNEVTGLPFSQFVKIIQEIIQEFIQGTDEGSHCIRKRSAHLSIIFI